MRNLEAEEIAARLTWVSAPGTTLDAETERLLKLGAAGLVLFERNIESLAQVADLCARATAAASVPLRIAIDQEGGHIIRLAEPLTRLPSLMAIGATRSSHLAFETARASAIELAALGIDTIFGPVLDLAADPRSLVVGARSLGSYPASVARLGAAMVAGYHAGGLLTVAKHFPGHGRTAADSHLELPHVGGTIGQLQTQDLGPFRAAVAAGVDALMVSHCVYDRLDTVPGTFSSAVMNGIARRQMGFRGVLMTDALVMDAVSRDSSIADAAVRSVIAGADAVLPLAREADVIEALAKAIRDGRVPPRRAAASVKRHSSMARARRLLVTDGDGKPGKSTSIAHARLAQRVADRSMTLVDGQVPQIPRGKRLVVVELPFDRPSPIEDGASGYDSISALRETFPRAQHLVLSVDDLVERRLPVAFGKSHVIVLLTRDDARFASLPALARGLGKKSWLIHVALRNPHDLSLTAGIARTRIAAYSDTPATVAVLGQKLHSGGPWRGRLPVPDSWVGEPPTSRNDSDDEIAA